jgi:hypothetical protein
MVMLLDEFKRCSMWEQPGISSGWCQRVLESNGYDVRGVWQVRHLGAARDQEPKGVRK